MLCDARRATAALLHARPLIEQTKAHVVVRLLLLLFLLLLFLLRVATVAAGSTSGSGATCATARTARWNAGELGGTLSDELTTDVRIPLVASMPSTNLVDVLVLELVDQSLEAVVVGLDSDRGKNLLNVLRRRAGVSGEAEEEVRCEVLHDGCLELDCAVSRRLAGTRRTHRLEL
jgi:hypothetical protein